jgi:hypothetical protein
VTLQAVTTDAVAHDMIVDGFFDFGGLVAKSIDRSIDRSIAAKIL